MKRKTMRALGLTMATVLTLGLTACGSGETSSSGEASSKQETESKSSEAVSSETVKERRGRTMIRPRLQL